MIDLAFYGTRFIFWRRTSKGEKTVLNAWHEYHNHLATPFTEEAGAVWGTTREELFINLLFALGEHLGYEFDRVQLKKGAYSPQAHGNYEDDQNKIRELTLDVLSRKSPIDLNIVGLPLNADVLKSQMEFLSKVSSTIDESGAYKIAIQHPSSPT